MRQAFHETKTIEKYADIHKDSDDESDEELHNEEWFENASLRQMIWRKGGKKQKTKKSTLTTTITVNDAKFLLQRKRFREFKAMYKMNNPGKNATEMEMMKVFKKQKGEFGMASSDEAGPNDSDWDGIWRGRNLFWVTFESIGFECCFVE